MPISIDTIVVIVALPVPGSDGNIAHDDADHLILSRWQLASVWRMEVFASDAMGRVVLTGVCRNEVADVSTFPCGVVGGGSIFALQYGYNIRRLFHSWSDIILLCCIRFTIMTVMLSLVKTVFRFMRMMKA